MASVKEAQVAYDQSKRLTHQERVSLFHALVAFLCCCSHPVIAQETIELFTVHTAVQAFAEMQEDQTKEYVEIRILCRNDDGAIETTDHYIPSNIVDGLYVYYMAVRPYFVSRDNPPGPICQAVDGDDRVIITEPFFVNSNSSTNFRITGCLESFSQQVVYSSKYD